MLGFWVFPLASHTVMPGSYLLLVFGYLFWYLTWGVNLSAKQYIISVAITFFQRPLQKAFPTDLKIWLPIKWAASTQFASCLLLREPAVGFTHKSFWSKEREDFVNLDLWAPSYWFKISWWMCVTLCFLLPWENKGWMDVENQAYSS